MRLFFLSFLTVCLFGLPLLAAEYHVANAGELSQLVLKPGDRVVLNPGVWKNQQLKFSGVGTKEKPIIFSAKALGDVVLSEGITVLIDGAYLQVENLKFLNPDVQRGIIVTFSKSSENCRFTNNVIVQESDYSVDKAHYFHWISMSGRYNRIDHCYFKGKSNRGCTIAAEASQTPVYNRIDHNYFDFRPELGENGGETVRIGLSSTSLFSARITVEENIFKNCDGEVEIISNKSCDNIIRNNLFYHSKGTITLRHGKRAVVEGNYFIGDGSTSFGGIRVTGEGHRVYNNYFYKIGGKGHYGPISFRNAWENSPLHGYDQVKDCLVYSNTFVDCETPFYVGVGKDEKSVVIPVATQVFNNVLYGNRKSLEVVEPDHRIEFKNNLIGQNATEDHPGFVKVRIELTGKSGVANVKFDSDVAVLKVPGGTPEQIGASKPDKIQLDVWKGRSIGPKGYALDTSFGF